MLFIRQHLIWIIVAIVGIAGLLGWVIWESHNINKPKPGVEQLQDGRNHVPHGQKVDYKFNPPTSGDHYADWITKGFYNEPRDDGSIVHSLEHGYIVINYDCEQKIGFNFGLIPEVYAHEEATASGTASGNIDDKGRAAMTAGSEGVPAISLANMPESFRNGSCDTLKGDLKKVFEEYGPFKMIVQPRVGMDSPIILTAWGRSEKLSSVDKSKIKNFIDALRDQGPEKTVEP